jgi:pimeloyl-ACP methyl ester carboxylesterase
VTCGAVRTVEANGLGLRLHEWGRAGDPPVLLLHSLAAHGHWWDWAAPRLAAGRHVVAADFRGHGGSAWAEPASYRFADYVADTLAVLDALGWRAPLVIGHSLGGFVGANLAALHPMRVGTLVIADILTGWTDDLEARARRQAERPPAVFASPAEAAAGFRLVPPETRAAADRLAHLAEAGVVERGPRRWEWAFDRRVFLHPPVNPWPFLPGVLCPTLVVRGERSPLMDRDQMLRVATAVRQGQFGELKNAYHHLILDDPAGFAALVTAWAPA